MKNIYTSKTCSSIGGNEDVNGKWLYTVQRNWTQNAVKIDCKNITATLSVIVRRIISLRVKRLKIGSVKKQNKSGVTA